MAAASPPQDPSPPSLLPPSERSPPPPPSANSRRLPPPCWSHDETVALIDAYREKWYSLRRGNLRANHWQEVADSVTEKCSPDGNNPAKTSVQCRHKMEKLRKRYRSEIQRGVTTPKGIRYCSSWVHFNRMDAMEKGSDVKESVNPVSVYRDDDGEEDDEEEEDLDDLYIRGNRQAIPLYKSNKIRYVSVTNGISGKSNSGSGVRIKLPTATAVAGPPVAKMYPNFEEYRTSAPNPNSSKVQREFYSGRTIGTHKIGGGGGGGGEGKRRDGNPVEEMVSAIKTLGDGYVRLEKMKMDMARELEATRMEVEMKRTQMILESQQRIVDTFANALSDSRNKKAKKMPSPET